MLTEMENSEERISKINTAGLQNLRRNEIWNDANNHSRQGLYVNWNEDLDRIWLELIGTVQEGSPDEKEWNKINEKCYELLKPLEKKGFKKIDGEDYARILKMKNILMKKETFLRRLEDKQGKGTAYDEGDEDYMD